MPATVHIPVMLEEVLTGLQIQSDGIYIDATFGGGGHSREILKKLSPRGKLIGIDRNPSALIIGEALQAEARAGGWGSLELVQANFSDIDRIAKQSQVAHLNGVLFDLGLSSDLLEAERGFSFRDETSLDMRYDPANELTAADLVNLMEVEELQDIFTQFGEEPHARKIAQAIVAWRESKQPFRTAVELKTCIEAVVPRFPGQRIHPATRVFQALRIVVNREFQSLQDGLDGAITNLMVGGRIAVITFHSLEDRFVKKTFKRHAGHCVCFKPPELCRCDKSQDIKILTTKPLIPSTAEIKTNSRSRSAKLRIAQKI